MPAKMDFKGIEEAHRGVERACEMLRDPTPAGLDGCSIALESAACQVRQWGARVISEAGRAEALNHALKLKNSIHRAIALLQKAEDYHRLWGRRLAAMSAGYTSAGAPADVPAGRPVRVCVRG